MMDHQNGSTMLHLLHYLTPISVLLTFAISRTVAACLLVKPTKVSNKTTRRYTAILLLLSVSVTVVAQGMTDIGRSLASPNWWAAQDSVVYVFGSVFAYGSMAINLIESSTPVWYPFNIACTIAAILEIIISSLDARMLPARNDFAFCRLALQFTKSLLLTIFTVCITCYAINDRRKSIVLESEIDPLLSSSGISENDEDFDDGGSSEVDSDSDEPEQIKELKLQQKKRLEESGNWLNYLKDFKIFIPMLWPSRDRFIQACLLVIGLTLISERFLNVLVPRQLGIITDELTKGDGNGVFPWKAVAIWAVLSYLSSRAGVRMIESLAELPVQQFAYKSIGSTAFQHVMGLSMDFHNEKNSGEIIRAINQGTNMTELLDFTCFQVGPMFIDLVIAFIYVYTLFDVYMSLILMLVGSAYVWVGAKTTAWSVKRRRRFNTASRNESKVQNETISNWQTVSHFNRGQYECERYDSAINEYNKAEMSFFIAQYIGSGAQTLVMVLGRLAATYLAVYRVSQGTVPVGHFVTLTAYWGSIQGPLSSLSWSVRRLTQMLTDAERLLQLLLTKPTVTDVPNALDIVVKEGHVEFDHVEFAYDARRPTLKDVSFRAKPGQTIALVGETGGGKSTILKLLYRYYDVFNGVIRIDGQDIRGVTLDSLRDSFGMVPQDPSLFNISIMENIRYANLSATDEQVKEACKAAAIHDKIESFPDKYKSTVGERGVKLSGGELQRVAIARAILRQPKIVLLDEATSMIDAETEASIQEAFKRLTASRTTFIIAHRLSTIQHADLILVIHDGQIVERGTHDELFRQNGKYVALWSKQLSKDVREIGHTLQVEDQDEPLIDVDAVRGVSSR